MHLGETEIYHEALTSPEEELESIHSGKKQITQRNKTQTKVKQQQKKRKPKQNKKKDPERSKIYLLIWQLIALTGGTPSMVVSGAPVIFCQIPNTSPQKGAQRERDCCFPKKTPMNVYFLFRKATPFL